MSLPAHLPHGDRTTPCQSPSRSVFSRRWAAISVLRRLVPALLALSALLLLSARLAAQTPAEQKPPEVGPGTQLSRAKITWPGITGRVYFIQAATTPSGPWSYAPFVELGAGANLSWEFETNGGRGFVRLKYSLNTDQTAGRLGDLDGDGLTNETEVTTTHTDPDNPDSDLDGMPDGWEISFGLNPLADDSVLDSDNDGLKNLLEYQLGTKPKRVGTDDGTDSDGDGLKDAEEYNNGDGGTDPAKFDMPILSIMQYSRECSLEDRRQPAYADRHNWTDSPAYRRASGTGFNGAGTQKPTWLNAGPWQTTGAMNPSGASNAFFDEVQGPLPWGDPQSVGTTLHAWLRQVYSWEDKYRVQRVRTRQIRYFLRASRKMPIEMKVRAVVTRWLRQGVLDAPWTGGGDVETNTLTLAAGQMDSNELTLNPTSYPAVTPGLTTDAAPRSVGDNYFTVSIREYPYTITGSDSDGDGLPNTVEASMGTSTTSADTDGDGRKDFFDFISARAGALAPDGKATSASSPTEEEQPWIEYVWRGGHLCPATHWTGSDGDKNVINSHASHWDFGIKDDTLNPAPASSTTAMQAAWTLEPDFPLELPGTNTPPAAVLDESTDISTILYSHNLLKNYTTSGSTWPGGDGREVLFRLRRETASARPFSRTFLIVDRKKTDTAAPAWTYTSLTPYTLTIPENKTVSNAVSPTSNPLKLPDTVIPAGGKASDHEVFALPVKIEIQRGDIPREKPTWMTQNGIIRDLVSVWDVDDSPAGPGREMDWLKVRVNFGGPDGGLPPGVTLPAGTIKWQIDQLSSVPDNTFVTPMLKWAGKFGFHSVAIDVSGKHYKVYIHIPDVKNLNQTQWVALQIASGPFGAAGAANARLAASLAEDWANAQTQFPEPARNALEHASWIGFCAWDLTIGYERAIKLGEAHEYVNKSGPVSTPFESSIDLANNFAGADFSRQNNPGRTPSTLLGDILMLRQNGLLWIPDHPANQFKGIRASQKSDGTPIFPTP